MGPQMTPSDFYLKPQFQPSFSSTIAIFRFYIGMYLFSLLWMNFHYFILLQKNYEFRPWINLNNFEIDDIERLVDVTQHELLSLYCLASISARMTRID